MRRVVIALILAGLLALATASVAFASGPDVGISGTPTSAGDAPPAAGQINVAEGHSGISISAP